MNIERERSKPEIHKIWNQESLKCFEISLKTITYCNLKKKKLSHDLKIDANFSSQRRMRSCQRVRAAISAADEMLYHYT